MVRPLRRSKENDGTAEATSMKLAPSKKDDRLHPSWTAVANAAVVAPDHAKAAVRDPVCPFGVDAGHNPAALERRGRVHPDDGSTGAADDSALRTGVLLSGARPAVPWLRV